MSVSSEIHKEVNTITQWNGMIVGAAMLIIIGLSTWGANELVNIKSSLQQVSADLASLKDITELKMKVSSAEINAEFAGLAQRVDRLEQNDRQMWPRLRALSTNDSIISKEIEKNHPGSNIVLKEPEAY